MPLLIRLVTIAIALASWLTPLGAGAQSQESDYDEAIRQALREQSLGNWAEMYAAMRLAHRISPSARTLRGLGVAAFELRNYAIAVKHLRASLTDPRKPLTESMRDRVDKSLKMALTYVDRVYVTIDPPEATVTVDGKEPIFDDDGAILVALGDRQFVAQLAGYDPATQSVNAVGGATHRIALQLSLTPMEPAADPARPGPATTTDTEGGDSQVMWGIVALASAGAFAIGAGISYGVYRSASRTYNSPECAPNRSVKCADEADTVATTEVLGIAFGATAGALAITGTVLLLTADGDGEQSSSAAGFRCGVAPLGVSCTGSF